MNNKIKISGGDKSTGITISAGSSGGEINVSHKARNPICPGSDFEQTVVNVTNNRASYYEELAEKYAEQAKNSALESAASLSNAIRILTDCENIKSELDDNLQLHTENHENPHEVSASQLNVYTKTESDNKYLTEHQDISGKANTSDLSTVATTGDYDDLTNKPVIDSAMSTTSTNAVQNKIITEALVDYENLIPVTYSELVTLKTGGNLVEGAYYRITDYVTTTNGFTIQTGHPTRSAGHAFDIIIQATGTSNLAEIGTAALHSGDTYFASQNLGAWQIWYDINNNTSKYLWADTTNGKGVIYRMIDEKGNDLPYDFKNIQFYRDKTDTKYTNIASTYLLSPDDYYYTFSKAVNNVIQDYSVVGGTYCIQNVFEGGRLYQDGTYTFMETVFIVLPQSGNQQKYINNNTFGSDSYLNTLCNEVRGNTVASSFHHNVINAMYDNTIGINFYNNTFADYLSGNIIAREFHDNSFKGYVYGNYIGNQFYNNTFNSTEQFQNNIINGQFYNNTVSHDFFFNIVNSTFHDNTMSSWFQFNTVGANCYSNTFSDYVSGCEIGAYCYSNTFGGSLHQNFIGAKFNNNTCSKYIQHCSFGANNASNSFSGTLAFCSTGNFLQYVNATGNLQGVTFGDVNGAFTMGTHNSLTISPNLIGSSPTNKLDLTAIPSGKSVNLFKGENNEIIAKWNDGANEMGLIKATVTTSTWSDLLPTFTWET